MAESQWPVKSANVSLPNLILPVQTFMESAPARKGFNLNSKSADVRSQTTLIEPPNSMDNVPKISPLQ
uniref:Uncharacterized protein n=1 Tax=Romanomermis culicivorax TaxID=13658 RepID=A0A915KZK3_ROMCU